MCVSHKRERAQKNIEKESRVLFSSSGTVVADDYGVQYRYIGDQVGGPRGTDRAALVRGEIGTSFCRDFSAPRPRLSPIPAASDTLRLADPPRRGAGGRKVAVPAPIYGDFRVCWGGRYARVKLEGLFDGIISRRAHPAS